MRRLALSLVLFLSLFAVWNAFSQVRAADLFPPCDGAAAESAVCRGKGKDETPDCNSFYGKCGVLTKVVKLYSIVTGVAAVIVLIIAGFKLVVASGDPQNIKSARDTATFAVVGLLVAALGAAIVQFVLVKL